MPDAPDPVIGTPNVPGQPYDATSDVALGKWQPVDSESGPCDMNGHATGDFESGPAPWKQT
jgi:hypothetical protein